MTDDKLNETQTHFHTLVN